MKIHVLFFSLLRDISGTERLELAFEGATVADLLKKLYGEFPDLSKWDSSLLLAVNCEYARRDQSLQDNDEVALMPPVQGG